MTHTPYYDYGFLLEDGSAVTLDTFQPYFKHYVRVYAGYDYAEFRKVELDTRLDQFVLEYAVPAEYCGTCDEAGLTEGMCEGHDDPRQEFVNYKTVNLYTYA